WSRLACAHPGAYCAHTPRIEAGTRQPSVKALRRLAGKLGVTADYLETGSDFDPSYERELTPTDLALGMPVGEIEGAEAALAELADDALAAGDKRTVLRANVALGLLAQDRGEVGRAVTLL